MQKSPPADTVTFIDLRASPPKVLAEIDVPNSVVGPPTNVAISPKEDIALVASSMQIDPADPTKQIPDDRLTVIDLSPLKPSLVGRLSTAVGAAPKGGAPAPKVLTTLQAGKGASGRLHQQGGDPGSGRQPGRGHRLRVHHQRHDGDAGGQSDGRQAGIGPGHVVFAPDGKTRARHPQQRQSRRRCSRWTATRWTLTKREIASGLRPTAIDVAAKGEVAVVANIGISGSGDANTIGVIDLKLDPPRMVNSYTRRCRRPRE